MWMLIAVCGLLASGLLWWRLSLLSDENSRLSAEVLRLRGRLRDLRP